MQQGTLKSNAAKVLARNRRAQHACDTHLKPVLQGGAAPSHAVQQEATLSHDPALSTPLAPLEPPRWWEPGAECWHCHGRGLCRCIVCDAGFGAESLAGPCTICGRSGRVPERVQ